ncbi:MAG: hypothetical protein ABTQ26_08130 [Azonexus sp.]
MKKILFADLDDTLFQSHRKLDPAKNWLPLAYLADGSPISYANPQQQAALQLFQREMTLIPVTARNHDAFHRVKIAFSAEAVINYGGIILNTDGSPDEAWLANSQEQAREGELDMLEWVEAITRESDRLQLDLRVRLISDFGIPFYVVAKSKSGNAAAVETAAEFCKRSRANGGHADVFIHTNTNNLALIPRWLDKRNAVEYLRRRYADQHKEVLTFGMGDSLVDLNFVAACDYMIVPAASQIASMRLGSAQ